MFFDLCLLKREVMKNMTANDMDILVTYFFMYGQYGKNCGIYRLLSECRHL